MNDDVHIVIAGDRVLVAKRPGRDWRALQEEFPDYLTSLGPCDRTQALDLIAAEWPDLARDRAADLAAFFAGPETLISL